MTPDQAIAIMKLKQTEASSKSAESSPYDTWGGTLSEIGKVLGSGLEQGATSIAGTPRFIGDTYNAALEYVPESARPYVGKAVDALNPIVGASRALTAAGAPSSGEMDQYLRDKGLQHTPINAYEDWAQYLTGAAASAAIPVGTEASLANMAKSAAASVLPAAAGKGVADTFDSPTAGLVASILTAMGQHGVGKAFSPETSASKQLGADVGPSQLDDFREYNRLGVPAVAADVVPTNSPSAAKLTKAVQEYPEKAKGLVETLTNREAGAGTRIKQNIAEATGTTATADQHLTSIMDEASTATKPLYDDIRNSDLYANNNKVLKDVIPFTKKTSKEPTLLQKTMTKVRDYLVVVDPETGVARANNQANASLAARDYIEGVVAKNPELESYLRPIYKKLSGALSTSYPEIIDADNTKAFADARKSAIEAGKKAASSGRQEDVASSFAELGKQKNGHVLQEDFKMGYGSKLTEGVENTPISGAATTPVNSRGQSSELTTLYGPDAVQKRDFELRARDTNRSFNVKPVDKKNLVEKLQHSPGYGFGLIPAIAGPVLSALTDTSLYGKLGLATGAVSGALTVGKLARDPLVAKHLLKASSITNAEDLAKFLAKGQKSGSSLQSGTKAGIINLLMNSGR